MEKGVHQAPQAEMVKMVSKALLVHLASLAPLAPLVLVGTLLLNMIQKQVEVALDQWV